MPKQTISITLPKNQLLFDIQTKAFYYSRANAESRTPQQNASIFIDEQDLQQEIPQLILSAYNQLRLTLSEFLLDNEEEIPAQPTFLFSLPQNFLLTAVQPLTSALHDYIVTYTLANWLQYTIPEASLKLKNELPTHIALAQEAISQRQRPTKNCKI